MKRILTLTVLAAMVLAVSVNNSGAQRPWYRGNLREIIRQLETDTDRFKSSLDHALDKSRLDGTRAEDEKFSPGAANEVLTRGRTITVFMRTPRLRGDAESDWARVRNDLGRLANAYYIRWKW